jgi:Tfp pilus assembly protein PilZ
MKKKRFETRRMAGIQMEMITPSSDLPIEFTTWDLSPRGAYVMSDANPRIGQQVICMFSLESDPREYCLFGEIARIDPKRRYEDHGPRGFAVKFYSTPVERLALRNKLSGLMPSMPSKPRDNSLTSAMGWS